MIVHRAPNMAGSPYDGMLLKRSLSGDLHASMRAATVEWLAAPLGGDILAAELLLLQLITRCGCLITRALTCCAINLLRGGCRDRNGGDVRPRAGKLKPQALKSAWVQERGRVQWGHPGPHDPQSLRPARPTPERAHAGRAASSARCKHATVHRGGQRLVWARSCGAGAANAGASSWCDDAGRRSGGRGCGCYLPRRAAAPRHRQGVRSQRTLRGCIRFLVIRPSKRM